MVVKQETEELFQPIRTQLQWTLPLLLLFVGTGAILLRSQVKPLATRLLLSEREVKENESRIHTVVDNVAEGIFTFDEYGAIESFNAAASVIFGHTQEEALGKNIHLLMPHDVRAQHEAGLKRYLAGGHSSIIGNKNVELLGIHKNGAILHLELAVNELRVAERRLFVGIVRDITERKQAKLRCLKKKNDSTSRSVPSATPSSRPTLPEK